MRIGFWAVFLLAECWMAGPTAWDYIRLKQGGMSGEARIVERSTVAMHRGRTNRLVYDVEVEGRNYRRIEDGVSHELMLRASGRVPVVYLPSNPEVATINLDDLQFRALLYGLSLPLILGLAFGISQVEKAIKRARSLVRPQATDTGTTASAGS